MAKRVSVRQLNRQFKEITKQLPVIITIKGKDAFILSDIKASDNLSDKDSVRQQPNMSDKEEVSDTEDKPKLSDKPIRAEKLRHKPFDICPKHRVFYKSCGCK